MLISNQTVGMGKVLFIAVFQEISEQKLELDIHYFQSPHELMHQALSIDS